MWVGAPSGAADRARTEGRSETFGKPKTRSARANFGGPTGRLAAHGDTSGATHPAMTCVPVVPGRKRDLSRDTSDLHERAGSTAVMCRSDCTHDRSRLHDDAIETHRAIDRDCTTMPSRLITRSDRIDRTCRAISSRDQVALHASAAWIDRACGRPFTRVKPRLHSLSVRSPVHVRSLGWCHQVALHARAG
jgi:hypothetical protein